MRSELMPAMREAFLLMPTLWIYKPSAVLRSTSDVIRMHTMATTIGVGINPR